MNATRGAIRPPPAEDSRVVAHVEDRRRAADFWSHYDANESSPSRWVDSTTAYWRPAIEVIVP